MSEIITMFCQKWMFQGDAGPHLTLMYLCGFVFRNSVSLNLATKRLNRTLGQVINKKDLKLLIGFISVIISNSLHKSWLWPFK